jgi:transposase InsO family protein
VRSWVKQAEIDQGERPGLTTEERAELTELRRENRSLREDVEILKRSTASSLEVSKSAYYERHKGVPSARQLSDADLTEKITAIHAESKGTYGAPRIHRELVHPHVACGKRKVTRLMRAAGLEGRCKRRWRTTTVADPTAEAARDLIQRHFDPCAEMDRRYVGDITYIGTWEGWAYLATVIDLASRKVVGWALAEHMRTDWSKTPSPWRSNTGHPTRRHLSFGPGVPIHEQ